MTSSAVEVSIVIPAFNEAKRISSTLAHVVFFFQSQNNSFEVVVVDDGSTDATAEAVSIAALANPDIRLVRNERNRGKGYTVRHGVLEAVGEIVLFTDADLSAPIEESPKLIDPIRSGTLDVTIGSRAVNRNLIGIHQPWLREQSGKIFNRLVRMILGLPFADTQCGFKAFRRKPMLPVFERLDILGFGFDPELLYVATLRRLRIGEIPVRWDHVAGSKVSFLSDSLRMFFDLLRIRWNHFTGCYREEA